MKPEDIFKQANQNRVIIPGQEEQVQDPMALIAMEIQRLGMGLAHTSRTNALIGKATDMCQLSTQLLFNILVDKNIISKEELEKMYKEDVVDKYKEMEKEAKEYAEQQFKAQQEEQANAMKEATKEDNKASEAILSDAEEILDNVRHITKKDE